MTYFADLSPYSFLPGSIPVGVHALAVGWLDRTHTFNTGEVPEQFIEKLFSICRNHPSAKTRGYHPCEFCHDMRIESYPVTSEREGDVINLGSAEIRVVAEGGYWLVAPDLVIHYVEAHGYRPPEEFISAVLSERLAEEVRNM